MSPHLNELTREIIGAAIEVHRMLGPGILESTYRECLCKELSLRGLSFRKGYGIQVHYKGICGYRVDLLVADCIVVEIKAIEQLGRFMRRSC